jgi:PAS domain S-box-containing protein
VAFFRCVALFSSEPDSSEGAQLGRMHQRSIMIVLPGTFYVLRDDATFVLWNKTVESVPGFSSEEMRAVHALALFDLTEQSTMNDKIRQVFDRGDQVLVEAKLLDRNGQGTPYLLTGARIQRSGKYYLCGMGLDISLRHQQEEQLRLRERALHAASKHLLGIEVQAGEGRGAPDFARNAHRADRKKPDRHRPQHAPDGGGRMDRNARPDGFPQDQQLRRDAGAYNKEPLSAAAVST